MSYGEPDRGDHPWSMGQGEAEPFFRQALDAGVNFFDTANGTGRVAVKRSPARRSSPWSRATRS